MQPEMVSRAQCHCSRTAGNLGRQHCSPCSSPAESLCLHFIGGGNSNFKKKCFTQAAKFHFWHLFLPPPGRAGQWSCAAAAAHSVCCPCACRGHLGQGQSRRALPLHRVPPRICSCPRNSRAHGPAPALRSAAQGCSSAALTPA